MGTVSCAQNPQTCIRVQFYVPAPPRRDSARKRQSQQMLSGPCEDAAPAQAAVSRTSTPVSNRHLAPNNTTTPSDAKPRLRSSSTDPSVHLMAQTLGPGLHSTLRPGSKEGRVGAQGKMLSPRPNRSNAC